MTGTLSIVSTPIGNLEDITLRAVRVLREATLVACEDTRHTRKLLDHLGISVKTVSYHEHNEAERALELVEAVQRGERVALVSDAGTPLLSDPGFRVVHAAIEASIRVDVVPGPSAVLTALAGSGMGGGAFYFGGFLPAKRTQRSRTLSALAELDAVLVFYEAPHRIVESLEEIAALLPGRALCAARELTKFHEEWLRGDPNEIAATLRSRDTVKGEFTLVLGKPVIPLVTDDSETLSQAVARVMRNGTDRMEAIKEVARTRGLSKREAYRLLEESRRASTQD